MAFLAPSLVKLRDQVNAKWPNRSKLSDGWIGDSAHASRRSEHNPDPDGAVRALDVTNDPVHGPDASKVAEAIRLSRDPRVLYIISNGRIASPDKQDWAWRKYTGKNAHTKHFHTSVKKTDIGKKDTRPWAIDGVVNAPVNAVPVVVPQGAPILKKGSKGTDVVRLQTLLNAAGAKILVDSDFGKITDKAVRDFQRAHGLPSDGKVGPKTWAMLEPVAVDLPQPDTSPVRHAGSRFDQIVKHYEGYSNQLYSLDGVLHGGWGHAIQPGEPFYPGMLVSDAQIEAWFKADKETAEKRLLKHVQVRLLQHQFDAVASIIWNGGDWNDPEDKADSPFYYQTAYGVLANALNAEQWDTAAKIIEALGKKPTRSGRVFKGIETRRKTEAALFRGEAFTLA